MSLRCHRSREVAGHHPLTVVADCEGKGGALGVATDGHGANARVDVIGVQGCRIVLISDNRCAVVQRRRVQNGARAIYYKKVAGETTMKSRILGEAAAIVS